MKKSIIITIVLILSILLYLFIDYLNIMSWFMERINNDYLNIFIGGIVPIYLFFIAYYLVDKRITDNENEKKKNKESYLNLLLLETYKDCRSVIEDYEEKIKIVEKMDKKNPNKAITEYIKLEESYIFKNDDEIIKLLSEGYAEETTVTQYIIIKKMLVNMLKSKWVVDKIYDKKSKEDKYIDEAKKLSIKKENDIKEILDDVIESISKKMEE